jgi:CBS domain-containing protein
MELEKPTILDSSEPLSRAMNEISRTGLPVLITKNGRYAGLIDERSIRQKTSSPQKEKCETALEKTPSLSPESTVMDACRAFFAGRFKAIPVIEKGKIKGAVTRRTLLSELLGEKMLSKKRVQEVMTSPVASLPSGATIGQARHELRSHNVRRIVVTDGGRLSGILSAFDLATATAQPAQSSQFYKGGEKTSMDSHPISSYMKKQVETAERTESLAFAVRKMLGRQVSALVVCEGTSPVGIVTAKDILHAALAEEKVSRVFVSGLPYEQRDFQSEIVREGELLISKLGKNFDASVVAVHIKSDGSGFSVRARLDGNKASYNASATDFRLENALRHVFDELRRQAGEEKFSAVQKRKREEESRED